MKIAWLWMSGRNRTAVGAAGAFLFASVLLAGLVRSDGPSKPAPMGAPPPSASGPRIAVDPPSFDFGRTLPQKAVTREFNVRNFGDQDLVIERVSTSCGCTVADALAGKVVKPGGTQPLRVTLTTPSSPGATTKSVVVRSNDPARPLLEIKLKATVAAEPR
jgi:hypothetical protein